MEVAGGGLYFSHVSTWLPSHNFDYMVLLTSLSQSLKLPQTTGNCECRQSLVVNSQEFFHMTSRRPYWCPKTMKRRPCWCPKPILRELNSFLRQTLSFVAINFHRCWPRKWKQSMESSRDDDGDAGLRTKTSLKSEFALPQTYRAYSISSSNVGKLLESWILIGCIKVQEKKRKLLFCDVALDKNVKIFTL